MAKPTEKIVCECGKPFRGKDWEVCEDCYQKNLIDFGKKKSAIVVDFIKAKTELNTGPDDNCAYVSGSVLAWLDNTKASWEKPSSICCK